MIIDASYLTICIFAYMIECLLNTNISQFISTEAKVILQPDTHREMNNQMVPDSLEPVIKHHQLIAPSLHSQSTDVVKRGIREVSPVPAPIWPKYVAKGHVYNAIQKLNRIRPSTPTPLMNKNLQDESSVSQDYVNRSVPLSNNTNNKDIESNFKQNKGQQPTNSNFESHEIQDESKKERRIGVTNNAFIDSEDHRSKTSSDVQEKKSTEEPIYKESCIHKNNKYVSNIQIIQLNAQMKSVPKINNGPMFSKRSHERNLQKGQSDSIIADNNDLDEPIFNNRNRNMSPITEQSNEDSSSEIPAQMISSQNDSIVTDTLLQLTSFSLKSLNEGDNVYDTSNKALKQIDENFYIDASKNSSSNREVDEEDKKKEDMDKVIQELTKAVMKSKNVTTLTRAMNQRKALFVDSPYLSQRNRGGIKIVDGSKPYLTSKDSTGSTSSGITISSTSTEDSLDGSSTRRSRRFKRNANRMRNSVRTIQSLSRGSKGVDLMRNLWQQTGMITNGRKLLIDSLSEDEGSVSSGGRAKNVPSNINEPDNGMLIENRRFQMIIENEARYTEEPTSFHKANALEKDLLKRISSGGSTTTATYAEVYSKSQASSTSPGSSLGHSQSSNAQKILKSNNVIQSDANKTKISQSVNLSADEIRVDEDHRESLSSGSSVSGVPNAKSGRKVQFRRDVIANNQEVFTIENYDHIPIHGFSNNEKIKTASSIVNMNEMPNQQYGEPSNRWFIPSNRDFVHGKSDLEAYKQLREKSSSSASARSTSVSPIYNDTNDDKSSSSYKSIFSSPYFDYRKTHSKVRRSKESYNYSE